MSGKAPHIIPEGCGDQPPVATARNSAPQPDKGVDIFHSIPESQLLTLCLYGEARGEPLEGKVAVASVVVNRLKHKGWFGKTLREVILKPWQFSCFNPGDPNRETLERIAGDFCEYLNKYEALRECYWVAVGFLDGWLRSNVKGATHYHNVTLIPPNWTVGMKRIRQIGMHQFWQEQ